jgi:14-3-3 protein epsilon
VKFKADSVRHASADKPKASYQSTLQNANSGLTKASPAHLGLTLNYSVFLYEIICQKQEAIDLAHKSFKEVVNALDELTEGQHPEATLIL